MTALGVPGSKILLVDMGPDISERARARGVGSDVYNTCGLGGAGLFSDGKLTVPSDKAVIPSDPTIADLALHDALPNNNIGENESNNLYKYAYDLFRSLDVDFRQGQVATAAISQMCELFSAVGIYFKYRDVCQIEPSHLPRAIDSLRKRLESAGVTIQLSTRVLDISLDPANQFKYLTCLHHGRELVLGCRFMILAAGKAGMQWLVTQSERLGIAKTFRPIELGIRVEVPNRVLEPFTRIHRDLKLNRKINSSTLVKTFCTCAGGMVAPCRYDNVLVLGGYTGEKRSSNTNFALLVKTDMKVVNTIEYGFSVVRTINILGQGKPLVQKLGDMKRGIASTESDIQDNPVKTTLSLYTPGDISLGFPKFINDALLETLFVLERAIPGINDDSNIVSAPCLEHCYQKFLVSHDMETNIKGIYVAGDGAGYTNGMLSATASGILAARGLSKQWSEIADTLSNAR